MKIRKKRGEKETVVSVNFTFSMSLPLDHACVLFFVDNKELINTLSSCKMIFQ